MGRATRTREIAPGGSPSASRGKGSDKAKQVESEVVRELLDMAKESGELPWQRPWNLLAAMRNGISDREYRGVNIFFLAAVAEKEGYESRRWLTYRQAEEESFQQWRRSEGLPDNEESRDEYKQSGQYRGVRQGEKGTRIVVYVPVARRDSKGNPVVRPNGEVERFFRPCYHTVFNADQTDLEFPPDDEGIREDVSSIESAERIIEGFPGAPPISHSGDRAFYVPNEDRIQMPERERFHSDEDYYKTLFHEMIHATGHSSRTDRAKGDWSGMGSRSYAEEELVAEIGAAMLAARAGLDGQAIRVDNSAAYLQSWMKKLEDDPELLPRAARKAQAAVDYILGTTFEEDSAKKPST